MQPSADVNILCEWSGIPVHTQRVRIFAKDALGVNTFCLFSSLVVKSFWFCLSFWFVARCVARRRCYASRFLGCYLHRQQTRQVSLRERLRHVPHSLCSARLFEFGLFKKWCAKQPVVFIPRARRHAYTDTHTHTERYTHTHKQANTN